MEINETNNLLNMVMTGSNKPAATTASQKAAAAAVADFASLLENVDFGGKLSLAENKENSRPSRFEKNKVSENGLRQETKLTAAEDKKSTASVKKEENDSKAPVADRKNNEKSNNNSGKTEIANDDKHPVNKKEKAPVVDGKEKVSAAEMPEASSITQAEPVMAENVADDVNLYAVPLSLLAQMGNITVISPVDGALVETTGADLAAALTAAGFDGDVMVAVQPQTAENNSGQLTIEMIAVRNNIQGSIAEFGDAEVPVVSEVVDGKEAEAAFAGLLKKLSAAQTTTKEVPVAAVEQVPEDKVAGEQAAKLAEMLKSDNKLEIKVDVKEAKNAYRTPADLVADKTVVDEAVKVAEGKAPAGETVKAPQSQTITTAPLMQNNTVNILTAAQVQNAATVVETVAKSAANNVENVSAVSSHAAAVGSEFVAAAKINAAAEDLKTGFRDVYKGLSKEVVDQVKVNITKSAVKGIDKIDIQLKPEDLGHIEIKMQISKDGKLQAHIISSRPETAEVLQKEMQSLEKAFNDAGFQTDENSLSFSFRQEQSAQQQQEDNSGLRRFIGDILSSEADNDSLNADLYAAEGWDGKTALNIRV